jgi:hypothetical protein
MVGESQNNTERNIEAVIKQGRAFEGLLGDKFTLIANDTKARLEAANAAKQSQGQPILTEAQIKDQVAAELDEAAKKYTEVLKSAAKGDTKAATMDLKGITGALGSVKGFGGALMSGDIMGALSAIPDMLENSVIGKFIKALIGSFTGKSFTDSLGDENFNSGMDVISKDMGIDANALKKVLSNQTTPPVSGTPEISGFSKLGELTAPPGPSSIQKGAAAGK